MTTFLVLVPVDGSDAAQHIDARSGIVTSAEGQVSPQTVTVYFEGNRYGAENLRTFPERVQHAAGRMAVKYPTVARAQFSTADFVVVGVYHVDDGLEVTDHVTLNGWLAGHPATRP